MASKGLYSRIFSILCCWVAITNGWKDILAPIWNHHIVKRLFRYMISVLDRYMCQISVLVFVLVVSVSLLTRESMMVSSPSASLFKITPFLLFRSPITVPWNSVGTWTYDKGWLVSVQKAYLRYLNGVFSIMRKYQKVQMSGLEDPKVRLWLMAVSTSQMCKQYCKQLAEQIKAVSEIQEVVARAEIALRNRPSIYHFDGFQHARQDNMGMLYLHCHNGFHDDWTSFHVCLAECVLSCKLESHFITINWMCCTICERNLHTLQHINL